MDKIARGLFFLSIAGVLVGLSFAYGLAVARYEIWPYKAINSAHYLVSSYLKYGEFVPEGRRYVAPADAPRERFTVHAPDLQIGGHYVFGGWDGANHRYSVWLYDGTGSLIHTWALDYDALDPDGPLNESDMPHGLHVLADGSIIVGFDKGDVMARLDACGEPVWIRQGIFHHVLEPAEDGNIWTWRSDGTAYGHFHYLVKFDPDTGETLQEIDFIEDIVKEAGEVSTVFSVRPDYDFQTFQRTPDNEEEVDIFHPNDVEELPGRLAKSFPIFDPGDLLLSFRNIHLVTVIDPDDGNVKWWSNGPWRFQHDPDFLPDGYISVFDNNTGIGRSEIIKINPQTGDIRNELFDGEFRFYTGAMGKHQYIGNSNVLIIISGEGRAVEVTKTGTKVMEFNNVAPHDDTYNDIVFNAFWLEPGFFEKIPECTG